MKYMNLLCQILFVCMLCPLIAWADTSTYYGTATITSPANLGTIDLALNLDVTGMAIQRNTSYIMLDKTLLFPAVLPQISGTDVGPRVTGTASPTSFSLSTDNFNSSVSGKTVTRKVTLKNATVTNNGNAVSGTYTETIAGLGRDTVTVTGSFILVRPTVQTIVVELKDLNLDGCVGLNEIRGAGTSENVIEYNEMSQALHLFYNPQPSLKVCTEQTIKDALAEFYATQKQL